MWIWYSDLRKDGDIEGVEMPTYDDYDYFNVQVLVPQTWPAPPTYVYGLQRPREYQEMLFDDW